MHTKMKKYNVVLIVIIYTLILNFIGCQDITDLDKYKRPDWLAGKLYTQIKTQGELSLFARCLEITGYDTIINTSGVYTVFAPDDEAIKEYLSNNNYSSIEAIPKDVLLSIVKFHIIQNPWSKDQLMSVDVYGWIDTLDKNNDEPKGFKRETLFEVDEPVFGIGYDSKSKHIKIIDTSLTSFRRKMVVESRKYAPLFFSKYFQVTKLNVYDDYPFYFNRPFDSNNDIYFVNAKVIKPNIFAENGFIHIVDKVVKPLQNGYEILASDKKYEKFLNLINLFPEFTYNREKTLAQPGAKLGYQVDSLFDLAFPDLVFDLTNERTKAPKGVTGLPQNVTTRYNYGIFAPTNEAIDEFEANYFLGADKWGSLNNAPIHIKRMLVNSHMSNFSIYLTNIKNGFYNGENDFINIDQSNIIEKKFASNCSFIGVNKIVPPRALTSITGPIYLLRDYSFTMYAIEKSGLLPALKKENEKYLLYVEPDSKCIVDSSLYYEPYSERFFAFIRAGKGGQYQKFTLTINDLRTLILNHVAIGTPKRIAKREFLPNLGGNFLIFNNETGEVSGTAPTSDGFSGSVFMPNYPVLLSGNADNGQTFKIDNWFSFSSPTIYSYIQTNFPKFHSLLDKAGLIDKNAFIYKFISETDNYTVFVPTDSALNAYNIDTVSIENLKKLIRLHFIQGEIIFTDGNKPSKYYQTLRIDEKSTKFTTIFSKIYINPGIDEIKIKDKNNNDYVSIYYNDNKVNVIAGRITGEGTETFKMFISNAVIHKIDKVLLFNELNTSW